MTNLEVLMAARAKLAQGWCTCYLSVDRSGRPGTSNNPGAVKWCALGAIGAVLDIEHPMDLTQGRHVVGLLYEQLPYSYRTKVYFGLAGVANNVADFNNRHSQGEVLTLFDRAIAALKAKEPPKVAKVPDWTRMALDFAPFADDFTPVAPVRVKEEEWALTI